MLNDLRSTSDIGTVSADPSKRVQTGLEVPEVKVKQPSDCVSHTYGCNDCYTQPFQYSGGGQDSGVFTEFPLKRPIGTLSRDNTPLEPFRDPFPLLLE